MARGQAGPRRSGTCGAYSLRLRLTTMGGEFHPRRPVSKCETGKSKSAKPKSKIAKASGRFRGRGHQEALSLSRPVCSGDVLIVAACSRYPRHALCAVDLSRLDTPAPPGLPVLCFCVNGWKEQALFRRQPQNPPQTSEGRERGPDLPRPTLQLQRHLQRRCSAALQGGTCRAKARRYSGW